MKFKRTQICSGIAAALGTGLLALPAGVLAQESTRIEVTGSRIQSLVTTSAPVAEVSAEEFKFSGTTRVEDLLNTLPQLASSFDSFTVNPTVGYATADLRGLGTARTLVLVNGQRLQPGGIRSEARDLNQIPAALIKRVDILTGGASAVYGADAMAGVVNFILDNEFEGFSINAGISGYQHKNDNTYMRELMDRRGFTYPTGSSGIDGKAKNIDLAWGSKFADNKGHAMAYLTWRKNDELRQGARDWSSCALNAAGTACGGSGTTPNPTFFQDFSVNDAAGNPIIGYGEDPANPGTFIPTGQVIASIASGLNPDGTWGAQPGAYNFAPINHYQRPDERWTFGSSLKFEVNKNFKPFFESMFSNTNTRVQIAESGTFFANRLELNCTSPQLGSFCNDLGETTVSYIDAAGNEVEDAPAFIDRTKPVAVYVGKRNVEGGPRVSVIESSSFRVVAGTEGELGLGSWTYNASFLYGRTTSNESNLNDFLTDRVGSALLGCPEGSFSGCVPYNVWEPNGVTAAQAAGLSGVGMRQGTTSLRSFNAYFTGDIGVTLPTARDPISLVVGAEIRDEGYEVRSDTNMATGNFTGLGGPRPPCVARSA